MLSRVSGSSVFLLRSKTPTVTPCLKLLSDATPGVTTGIVCKQACSSLTVMRACSQLLQSGVHRAEADVYAAQIDDSLLMRIGSGNFKVPSGWITVDGGDGWAVYTRG